jgi:hypothetical protein
MAVNLNRAKSLPIIRTTERRDFKRCPQRWWWRWREGLVSRQISDPLWFGTGIHIALAHYYGPGYKRRMDFIDIWEDFCQNDPLSRLMLTESKDDGASYMKARELGIIMLRGYHEFYEGDRDWDVIYTEEPFSVIIPDPDTGEPLVRFVSTLDGVYRSKRSKKYALMEHKTAKAITTGHLTQDDQGGAYWAVANRILRDKGILGTGEFITEVTYNFLRKAPPDPREKDALGRALNKDGSISKVQPAPLFHRESVKRTIAKRRTQLERIAAETLAMNEFRYGNLPLYKNPTRDCGWDCDFKQMCELHDAGADWKEFKKAVFIKRDPYADHRKSASE